MRIRAFSGLLALTAILVAGVSFSSATFVAGSANPGNAFTASTAFSLTATMDDPGAHVRQTVSLTASASDGEDGSSITSVTIQRSPAGAGTWTDVCTDGSAPYGCSFDTTAVTDGLYDFRAIAQNDAGGAANSAPVANRRVDNTAPSVDFDDPGEPLVGTVAFSGSASDTGSGIGSVVFQYSPAGAGTWSDACSDASTPFSCGFDTTALGEGDFDFRAVATDNAGNPTTSATWADRLVDNLGPSVVLTDPGSPIAGTKTFLITATDGGSGVSAVTVQASPTGANTWSDLCSDTSSPYSCDYNTGGLADGAYDFRALAVDVAGNPATSAVRANKVIDNGFPTATMDDPGAYLRLTVPLTASASDAGTGVSQVVIQRSPAGGNTWTEICTDPGSPYGCSFDTTTVTDGLYDLRAVATDGASHATVSMVVSNRRVDNTAPSVSLTDPGSPLSGTKTFGMTASDGGSGIASVTVQASPTGANTWTDLCSDTASPYSCDYNTGGLADGFYDFRAVTADQALNPAISSVWANRAVDNGFPTVTMDDPGAYLRLTVPLTASASDSGTGVSQVVIQRSAAGAGTWTDVCTDPSTPYACSFNTTTVADGLYDFRAVATDGASHATISNVVANRRVDNTAPTGTNIQTANGGSTVGRAEVGDSVTFTFSEQIAPASILGTWNGTAVAVTVRIANNGTSDRLQIWDQPNTTQLPLTTTGGVNGVSLNGNHTTNGSTFTATMVQSGSAIVITLTGYVGGNVRTEGANVTMSWPTSNAVTDLAGNPLTAGTVTESGAADPEL